MLDAFSRTKASVSSGDQSYQSVSARIASFYTPEMANFSMDVSNGVIKQKKQPPFVVDRLICMNFLSWYLTHFCLLVTSKMKRAVIDALEELSMVCTNLLGLHLFFLANCFLFSYRWNLLSVLVLDHHPLPLPFLLLVWCSCTIRITIICTCYVASMITVCLKYLLSLLVLLIICITSFFDSCSSWSIYNGKVTYAISG